MPVCKKLWLWSSRWRLAVQRILYKLVDSTLFSACHILRGQVCRNALLQYTPMLPHMFRRTTQLARTMSWLRSAVMRWSMQTSFPLAIVAHAYSPASWEHD